MYLRIFVMLLKALHGIQKETTNKQKKTALICSGVLFCFFCKLLSFSLFFECIFISPIWCMMSAETTEKNCSYLKYELETLIFSLELVGHSSLECQDEQPCLQSPFLTSVMEGFLA